MDMKIQAVLISLTLLLNGCATATKSLLLGAAVGGVAGGAIGQNQSQNNEGAAVGLAIGAGIGSLISYLAYKDKKSKPEDGSKFKIDEDKFPFLTKPKIHSIIVPDTIEGNKYIESHKIYILDDPGSWSR
ncbi:MAG: glycine zipper 2TM domain-containing protein [Pseudobdellovibrio sp.]